MLRSFFLWFYCLSISGAISLIILFSAAFFCLRWLIGKKRFWKPTIALLSLFWLTIITAVTLMDRTPGSMSLAPELVPFHSYRAVMAGSNPEILRSNFMNVLLFYPAGLLACELLPQGWQRAGKVILLTVLFALISVGIEFCQYHFALGQAEIDDVIHNALGALLGALVCTLHIKKTVD